MSVDQMSVEQMTDDQLLAAVYRDYQHNPLIMQFAKRFEQAQERADLETTPTTTP